MTTYNDPTAINNNPASVDQEEFATIDATCSQPSKSPLPLVEADLLEGFNPDNYKDGVEADERFRILDLYLGWLSGQLVEYDPLKIRLLLVKWNEKNKPPLDFLEIRNHVKANYDKWVRYHYLNRTATRGGIR